EEKAVALVLQKYIAAAFPLGFPIFVSTDQISIGGGRKWFQYIIDNLHKRRVMLVLVSQESAHREWINFESGFGSAAGATVIPIAIKGFSLSNLKFPLAGFQGRL